ncbi:MAG: hypothetical protein HQL07_02255 [Nitrospirae bacterium]|nr:hypothetical protein [Magnetococcales bacterium]
MLIILFGMRLKYTYMSNHQNYLGFMIYFSYILPMIAMIAGSFHDDFDWLYSLRHATYFLYGAFFIFAFVHAYRIIYILGKLVPVVFVLSFINGSWHLMGMAWVGIASNPVLRKYTIVVIFITILNMLFLGETISDSLYERLMTITVVATITATLLKRWATLYDKKSIIIIRSFILTGFVLMVGFFLFLSIFVRELHLENATSFGDISDNVSVIDDNNTTWRAAYWGYLLGRLPENPAGIGIGRPILPLSVKNVFLYDQGRGLRYEHFFTAAHNGLVTLTVLTGPFFLIPFIFFLWHIPRLVYKSVSAYSVDKNSGILLLVLFLNALHAFIGIGVHVYLESPLHASIVWVALGLWFRMAVDYGNAGFIMVKNSKETRKIPLTWGDEV